MDKPTIGQRIGAAVHTALWGDGPENYDDGANGRAQLINSYDRDHQVTRKVAYGRGSGKSPNNSRCRAKTAGG